MQVIHSIRTSAYLPLSEKIRLNLYCGFAVVVLVVVLFCFILFYYIKTPPKIWWNFWTLFSGKSTFTYKHFEKDFQLFTNFIEPLHALQLNSPWTRRFPQPLFLALLLIPLRNRKEGIPIPAENIPLRKMVLTMNRLFRQKNQQGDIGIEPHVTSNGLNGHTQNIPPKRSKRHILPKCMWNILQGRSW